MSKQLPERPNLDHLRSQAKKLLSAFRSGDPESIARFGLALPGLAGLTPDEIRAKPLALHDAQSAIAREYGFLKWADLVHEVERVRSLDGITEKVVETFVSLSQSPRYERCRRMVELYPGLPSYNLATALVWGNSEFVQSWMETGDLTEKIAPKGWQPIEYACYSALYLLDSDRAAGLFEIVRMLLDAGVDPNTSHPWTEGQPSPLSILFGASCEVGNPAITKLLLERGANPNDGESVFHAAQLNRTEILEMLVEHGADISHRDEHWSNTPMYFNAGHKPSDPGWETATKGIHWLLEHGADPNVKASSEEETALHCACRTNNAGLVRDLVEHGADVNAQRADGRTAYELAALTGNIEAMEILREAWGANELKPGEALLAACAFDDLPAAQRLLTSHPELKLLITSKEGAWALSKHAELGVTAGVRNLLELGCDPSTTDEMNQTPLHWACFHGWADCVDSLIAYSAPLDILDSTYHATPLGWAIQGTGWHRNPKGDYVRTVRSLLTAGADVEHLRGVLNDNEEVEELAELRPLLG